jgi:hypothetical protein
MRRARDHHVALPDSTSDGCGKDGDTRRGAGHSPATQQSAGGSHVDDSRCDADGSEYGSTATTDGALAVDDASVGIGGRCSTVNGWSARGHPAALHAWHRTRSDDDATSERRRNAAAGADAEYSGDSRNHCSGNRESSGHSKQMTEEGPIVPNISSSWVRRLWPVERPVVERTEHDDVRDLPRDEAPVTSPLRDRPQERATFRWPCWPLSGLRKTRSRRGSH